MQHHKVSMSKRKFRIGDLAKELKVKKYVIRFWEKEFDLESDRSEGGQRFYTKEDFKVFSTIKDLLYNRGFTIAGAKKELDGLLALVRENIGKKEEGNAPSINKQDQIVGAVREQEDVQTKEEFVANLTQLRKDLERLRNLLD